MPYDWAAYRKSHPDVAPRVEKLAKERAKKAAAPPPPQTSPPPQAPPPPAPSAVSTTPPAGSGVSEKNWKAMGPGQRSAVVSQVVRAQEAAKAEPKKVEPKKPAPPAPPEPEAKKVVTGEQLKKMAPAEFQEFYSKRGEYTVIPSKSALKKTGETLEQWSVRAGYDPKSVKKAQKTIEEQEKARAARAAREGPSEVPITRPIEKHIPVISKMVPFVGPVFGALERVKVPIRMTSKRAFELGMISEIELARASPGTTWESPFWASMEAMKLKQKYPKVKTTHPEERLVETFMRAERQLSSQRAQRERQAELKMELVAEDPRMQISYIMEEHGGLLAPISLGFASATVGISSMIRGEDPIKNIQKHFHQEIIGYTYRKAEEKPTFTLGPGKQWEGILPELKLPFQPAAAAKAGVGTTFMFAGVGGLGKVGVTAVKWAYRGMIGYQTFEIAKEPTLEKGVALGLMLAPAAVKLGKKHIKYTKIELPITGGKTKVVYRGISVEAFKRGQPVIGVSGGRPVIGTPKIDLGQADLSRGFIVETYSQTAIMRKAWVDFYPKKEIVKFEYGHGIMRGTEMVKSKFIQQEFIREAKAFRTKGGVEEVLKFAKREKGELYGSFGARSQMPKDLGRMPADIDIQLRLGGLATTKKAQLLLGRLKGVGERARISKRTPTLIETYKGGKWHHAVDIHSIDQAIKDMGSPSVAGSKAYGFKLQQDLIKIEGIKTMPLSEQGIRKGASMFTMRKGGFGPEAHRMKDITDFFAVQEALIRSKGISKMGLSLKLESLKRLYSGKLAKTQGPVRLMIYSPSGPSGPAFSQIFLGAPSVSAPSASPSRSLSLERMAMSLSRSVSRSEGRSPSISPSISPSMSISLSLGVSPSMSRSLSRSMARSLSLSIYGRGSPSRSPSIRSPSIRSMSRSPSISPSLSISVSPFVSPSISPSVSPSISSIISPGPSYGLYPSLSLGGRAFMPRRRARTRARAKPPTKYRPSLVGLYSGRTIEQEMRRLTGAETRYPVRKKRKGRGGK